ncbi:unnamed protein product [Adineta ricciae]|uniref:Uncharacterized protein n=1 Tax=Adineta ricciae TaxID=249248 RepID=A0A816EJV8_ADIRI|nr:unnamed protein product [Adineta ricciae]
MIFFTENEIETHQFHVPLKQCQLKGEQQAQQKYNDALGVQHEESQDSFVIDDGALPPDKPCAITISYVTELELVKNRTKIRIVVPTTLASRYNTNKEGISSLAGIMQRTRSISSIYNWTSLSRGKH